MLHALDEAEERRAAQLMQVAAQLTAGLLANPACLATPEEAAEAMLRIAARLEAGSRQVVADPGGVERGALGLAGTAGPSPQARAWGAGYRDAEEGRRYAYRGPAVLEADYWDGYSLAEDARQRAMTRR